MCEGVSRTMEVTIREIDDAKPRQSHAAMEGKTQYRHRMNVELRNTVNVWLKTGVLRLEFLMAVAASVLKLYSSNNPLNVLFENAFKKYTCFHEKKSAASLSSV